MRRWGSKVQRYLRAMNQEEKRGHRILNTENGSQISKYTHEQERRAIGLPEFREISNFRILIFGSSVCFFTDFFFFLTLLCSMGVNRVAHNRTQFLT